MSKRQNIVGGWKKYQKKCVECGDDISGLKDYCTPCHRKILERIKINRPHRPYFR